MQANREKGVNFTSTSTPSTLIFCLLSSQGRNDAYSIKPNGRTMGEFWEGKVIKKRMKPSKCEQHETIARSKHRNWGNSSDRTCTESWYGHKYREGWPQHEIIDRQRKIKCWWMTGNEKERRASLGVVGKRCDPEVRFPLLALLLL